MYKFREVKYEAKDTEKDIEKYVEKYVEEKININNLVLAGDIGGTNLNFGLVDIGNKKKRLIYSAHLLIRDVKSFSDAVTWILSRIKKKYNIEISCASFAAAGPVFDDGNKIEVVKLGWTIDRQELLQKTSLTKIKLLNDFEAIAYGVNAIDTKNITCLHRGQPVDKAPKIVIGAGTGLGKCLLVWNEHIKQYSTVSSEGGHADFPVYTREEFELMLFVRELRGQKLQEAVEWESVLSGGGISTIYKFLIKTKNYKESNEQVCKEIEQSNYDPAIISRYRNEDQCSKETFDLFARFFARAAKNLALETLSYGGIYLAGGIAAKNTNIFEQEAFLSEFFNSYERMFVLKKIPVFLVTDYNISLYGASHYLSL